MLVLLLVLVKKVGKSSSSNKEVGIDDGNPLGRKLAIIMVLDIAVV